MKTKHLYFSWLCLFILSAAMGFIREPSTLISVFLALLAGGFFVPGAMILYRGVQTGQRKHLRNVLLLGVGSLVSTVVLFSCYLVSMIYGTQLLSDILYAALVIVSAPMMCAPIMVLSFFLWACLVFTAIAFWKKTK
jgi:hypothetical protein